MSFYKKTLSIAALLLCTASVATANDLRSPTVEKINKTVEELMSSIPHAGVSVAILKDGQALHTLSYGYAELENKVPVTPDTVFQSGSVGKMFTALGVLLLEREGKLSLDDTLASFLPDGPEYWNRVTIGHLLSHRGGIGRIFDGEKLVEGFELQNDYTDDQLVKLFGSLPMNFEPGTKYEYSNPGYILLGIIIHKATGQFYGDFLKEHLFAPLGMTAAQVNDIWQVIPNRAQGYLVKEGRFLHDYYVSDTLSKTADGSLVFTIKDMIKWENMLASGDFLSDAEKERFYSGTTMTFPDQTIGVTKYGFGWVNDQIRGLRKVGHGGLWQGFRTYIGRFPADKFTVVVLTNTENSKAREIARAIMGLYNPQYGAFEALSDQSEAAKIKKIVDDYLADNIDRSLFAEPNSILTSSQQVQRINIEIKTTEDHNFQLVDIRKTDKSVTYTGRFTGEKDQKYLAMVEMNQAGKITNLNFQHDR